MLLISMVNSLGIFSYQMPSSNLNTSTGEAQITQLTDTMSQTQDTNSFSSVISGIGLITKSLSYLINVFWKSIDIRALGSAYGIDRKITEPFQAIYVFILIFGIYQFLTGRGTKIME